MLCGLLLCGIVCVKSLKHFIRDLIWDAIREGDFASIKCNNNSLVTLAAVSHHTNASALAEGSNSLNATKQIHALHYSIGVETTRTDKC